MFRKKTSRPALGAMDTLRCGKIVSPPLKPSVRYMSPENTRWPAAPAAV